MSQIATSNETITTRTRGRRHKLQFAFTEQGALQAASALNSARGRSIHLYFSRLCSTAWTAQCQQATGLTTQRHRHAAITPTLDPRSSHYRHYRHILLNLTDSSVLICVHQWQKVPALVPPWPRWTTMDPSLRRDDENDEYFNVLKMLSCRCLPRPSRPRAKHCFSKFSKPM